VAETILALARTLLVLWRADRIRRRVVREARRAPYTDIAITPLPPEDEEGLDLLKTRQQRVAAVAR